jgi:DNA-3-methyladenine glycosylase
MGSDVEKIGRQLLGKLLVTRIGGRVSSGIIVETEAYGGEGDRASHAFNDRKTARTEVMFSRGGIAYVYLCYGIHALFNVVTGGEGMPLAVLIRGVEPVEGIDLMLERTGKKKIDRTLTGGPGALTRALGIGLVHNRASLLGKTIWIEDRGVRVPPSEILASPRVGVAYAREAAAWHRRYRIAGSGWTSPAK